MRQVRLGDLEGFAARGWVSASRSRDKCLHRGAKTTLGERQSPWSLCLLDSYVQRGAGLDRGEAIDLSPDLESVRDLQELDPDPAT